MKKVFVFSIVFLLLLSVFFIRINIASQTIEISEVLPNTPLVVVETENFQENWKNIKESKIWQNINSNHSIAKIQHRIEIFDSLFNEYNVLFNFFDKRKIAASFHKTKSGNTEMIFIVDIKKSSKIEFMPDTLQFIQGFGVEKQNFQNNKIWKLTKDKQNFEIYITFIQNLLLASQSEELIKKSVSNTKKKHHATFAALYQQVETNDKIKAYFNHKALGKILEKHLTETTFVDELYKFLSESAFRINTQADNACFEGKIHIEQEAYFKLIPKNKSVATKVQKILSDKTCVFLSLKNSDARDLFKKISAQMKKNEPEKYKKMAESFKTAENELNTNFTHHILSWIGQEIALAKLSNNSKHENPFLLYLHANDIDKAKQRIQFVAEQMHKKYSHSGEDFIYKNHMVYVLEKLPFSIPLFDRETKFQKLFVSHIRDFIVVAFSKKTILSAIEDYQNKERLYNNENFKRFYKNFTKNKLFCFINFTKYFNELEANSNIYLKTTLERNKTLLSNIEFIGLQIQEDKAGNTAKMLLSYNPHAYIENKFATLTDNAFESLICAEIESGTFIVKIPPNNLQKDGHFLHVFKSGMVAEGELSNFKPNGLWQTNYPSGNMHSIVSYKEGKPTNVAVFYYDSPDATKRAEVRFENNKISGVYREYYETGLPKAIIYYQNGMRHGKALFFYEKGILKSEGKYTKGKITDKWRYFNEKGKLLR